LIEQFFIDKYKDIVLKCSETFFDTYGMQDLESATHLESGAPSPLYVTLTKTM